MTVSIEMYDALPQQIRDVVHHLPGNTMPHPLDLVTGYTISGCKNLDEYARHLIKIYQNKYPDWTPPTELSKYQS